MINEQQLLEAFRRLDSDQQQQAWDYLQQLGQPQGVLLRDLIARAEQINFDSSDLDEMAQAIEQFCEQIDPSAWDDNDVFA